MSALVPVAECPVAGLYGLLPMVLNGISKSWAHVPASIAATIY
jgi:hypothetical protein